ncbi:hypothetical protein LCGC14_1604010 [marine sediment metagenome]|uniref:Uncharacterized protein n=1 Tax=marine sediment metagenome TaxID=412755 RepID=A0A0F9IWX5_9ZZZZ
MKSILNFLEFVKIMIVVWIFYLIGKSLNDIHFILSTLFLLIIILLGLIIYNFAQQDGGGE